jgi:hypothetical protein
LDEIEHLGSFYHPRTTRIGIIFFPRGFWNDGNVYGTNAQCWYCECACVTKVGAGKLAIKKGITPKLAR